MGRGSLGGLNELFNDVRGRRTIRITHRHIDNVLTTPASRHLELSGDAKNIRWQPLNAGKLLHPKSSVIQPSQALFAVQQNPII
jgi:hypothetical protein